MTFSSCNLLATTPRRKNIVLSLGSQVFVFLSSPCKAIISKATLMCDSNSLYKIANKLFIMNQIKYVIGKHCLVLETPTIDLLMIHNYGLYSF